jgi:hypothetical protein
MPTDPRAEATARLAPEDRALIELFDRGLGAQEIAGVVGLEPGEVERRHRAAQARLAEAAAVRPARRRVDRRGLVVAALLVLAVAAGVAIAVAGGGGNGGAGRAGSRAGSPAATTPGAGTAAANGRVVTMRRLNGTYGRGTAQLRKTSSGARLRLAVSHFLRPVGGGYAVWLLDASGDARRLYATTDTSIERDLRLPRDFTHYRFVEVARAIPELTSPHSDLSLLRVRVSALAAP